MPNKINIGIIGRNFGYHIIYKSFIKNSNYKITGFSFGSKKRKKITFPKNVKIYTNWKQLILDKKITAIVIATPPYLHKRIIKFALKNNKHIFCEKPFTSSYSEANSICKIIKRKKNISHFVNYEFSNIEAFKFFKKKIINKIKINKIYLDWFINSNRGFKSGWKENHTKGGGIFFNYICHSIHYLEFLFGNISSVKTILTSDKEKNLRNLKGLIFFVNGLSVRLNMKVGFIKNKVEPIHSLKILSNKDNYHLVSKLNSLSDKFRLIKLNKNSNQISQILVKNKKKDEDFRIIPTLENSKKFSEWILKGKKQEPNFFNGKRIQLIIKKMLISSKTEKNININ